MNAILFSVCLCVRRKTIAIHLFTLLSSQTNAKLMPFLINSFYFSAIYGEQFVESTCNFPRNFSGTWYSTGEYDMSVTINTTHIYFKTLENQYWYKETYFTCIMNRDSRYLVSAVTVGKWYNVIYTVY